MSRDPNTGWDVVEEPDDGGGWVDEANPTRPTSLVDPRAVPPNVEPVPCCRVRQTLQIGPDEFAEVERFQDLWEAKSKLEMDHTDCGGGPGIGLLSINFVSFVSSSGDFSGPTREIEIFLIREGLKPDARQDVWSVPIVKRTVALALIQFPGGFPVPVSPGGGGARFELRTRVAQKNTGDKWSIMVGLMLTYQNAF